MIRTTTYIAILVAALCSGCASSDTKRSEEYAKLKTEPLPETRTVVLTGSRIRVTINMNDPSPDVKSPTDIIRGDDLNRLPWLRSSSMGR